jgi:hypothetical protein
VFLAAGFQHAARERTLAGSVLVPRAVEVAREVIHVMIDRLYPTGKLRYALEANFVYVSFAAAFLINVSSTLDKSLASNWTSLVAVEGGIPLAHQYSYPK